jgi:hypothetical protein
VIRPLCTVIPFCVVRVVNGQWTIARKSPRWIDALREPIERGEITPACAGAAEYLNLSRPARPLLRLAL